MTKTIVYSHICFEGRAQEAIDFYTRALGAEAGMVMRYKNFPGTPPPGCDFKGKEEKIMHARLRIGDSEILLTDGQCSGKPEFKGIMLCAAVGSVAEAEKTFKALGDGGKVDMPLDKTFFSPAFGMVTDRFGIQWEVYTEGPGPA